MSMITSATFLVRKMADYQIDFTENKMWRYPRGVKGAKIYTLANITSSLCISVESSVKFSEEMFTVYLQLDSEVYTDLQDSITLRHVNTKMWKRNKPLELYFTRTS